MFKSNSFSSASGFPAAPLQSPSSFQREELFKKKGRAFILNYLRKVADFQDPGLPVSRKIFSLFNYITQARVSKITAKGVCSARGFERFINAAAEKLLEKLNAKPEVSMSYGEACIYMCIILRANTVSDHTKSDAYKLALKAYCHTKSLIDTQFKNSLKQLNCPPLNFVLRSNKKKRIKTTISNLPCLQIFHEDDSKETVLATLFCVFHFKKITLPRLGRNRPDEYKSILMLYDESMAKHIGMQNSKITPQNLIGYIYIIRYACLKALPQKKVPLSEKDPLDNFPNARGLFLNLKESLSQLLLLSEDNRFFTTLFEKIHAPLNPSNHHELSNLLRNTYSLLEEKIEKLNCSVVAPRAHRPKTQQQVMPPSLRALGLFSHAASPPDTPNSVTLQRQPARRLCRNRCKTLSFKVLR